MPLSLSDEEMALLRSLAEPVAYGRRREFLCEVAAALEAVPQSGPGVLFRVAREVQRKYVVSSQRIDPSQGLRVGFGQMALGMGAPGQTGELV